jgi:hypothetical protein
VVEARVDHGVRRRRALAQTVEVIERTALYIGSGRSEGCGSRIRTSETEHLMARADEFWNDRRAKETCRPRDKNTHLLSSFLVRRAGPFQLQLRT